MLLLYQKVLRKIWTLNQKYLFTTFLIGSATIRIGEKMPVIKIEGPKIDIETKKNIVKDITEILSKHYDIPEEHFITYIKENNLENVGIGTQILSEKFKKE